MWNNFSLFFFSPFCAFQRAYKYHYSDYSSSECSLPSLHHLPGKLHNNHRAITSSSSFTGGAWGNPSRVSAVQLKRGGFSGNTASPCYQGHSALLSVSEPTSVICSMKMRGANVWEREQRALLWAYVPAGFSVYALLSVFVHPAS